jgi:hypothetical protein
MIWQVEYLIYDSYKKKIHITFIKVKLNIYNSYNIKVYSLTTSKNYLDSWTDLKLHYPISSI